MNEKRIWQMTRLAMYEGEDGAEDLQISDYYRRDYVGLGLLWNFVIITVAYFIIVAGVIIFHYETVMDYFYNLDIRGIVAAFVLLYVIMLAVSSFLVFVLRRTKYNNARRRVVQFYKRLNELDKDYENDEKPVRGRRMQY